MRACRRIAPLLLIAVVAPARSGAARDTPRVGTVVTLSPEVTGAMPGDHPRQLGSQAEVCEHMEVVTKAAAKATILIGDSKALCGAKDSNPPVPPSLRGALIMFPNSRVSFERWVIEQATQPELTLRAQLGEFLVYLMARPQVEGKVRIVTPSNDTFELHGTAVCLQVAPDGTATVAVLAGEVTIRSAAARAIRGAAARPVRVPQGSWTKVAPGRLPQRPALLGRRAGTLSPQAGGPAFTMPAELLVTDPPHLDLGRLLNLPKTGPP
jgi:hypothetical protein